MMCQPHQNFYFLVTPERLYRFSLVSAVSYSKKLTLKKFYSFVLLAIEFLTLQISIVSTILLKNITQKIFINIKSEPFATI